MTYNISQFNAATSITDAIKIANDWTDQIMMGGFLFVVFFVIVMLLKRYDFDQGILAASLACFILSLLLRQAGLVQLTVVLLFLTILAFSLLFTFFKR